MSDRPIQVGDLVMVVRGCCSWHLGHVYKVEEITSYGPFHCAPGGCNHRGHYVCARVPNKIATPLPWLKRLDPDALRDDVPADERLKERA